MLRWRGDSRRRRRRRASLEPVYIHVRMIPVLVGVPVGLSERWRRRARRSARVVHRRRGRGRAGGRRRRAHVGVHAALVFDLTRQFVLEHVLAVRLSLARRDGRTGESVGLSHHLGLR